MKLQLFPPSEDTSSYLICHKGTKLLLMVGLGNFLELDGINEYGCEEVKRLLENLQM